VVVEAAVQSAKSSTGPRVVTGKMVGALLDRPRYRFTTIRIDGP